MNPTRNSIRSEAHRGFTILEVVVAMIIISILTLVMMPTVTNRANQARLTVVEADLKALAEAESRASIDMNYYVVPWRLNNVIGSSVARLNTGNLDPAVLDAYANYNDMFIDIITLDIPGNITNLHTSFTENETNFGWGGPYLNFQKDDNGNNWPEDPWGNEYILLTKAGGLFPPEADGTTMDFELIGPSFVQLNGITNTGITDVDEIFDRPTWLSLGPNELPGDGLGLQYGEGDDIYLSFEGLDGSDGP